MWWSSCSENTQKTNLRQLILQCCRLQHSNFNGTELHHGDLLEKFKRRKILQKSAY